jgi:hypothetical protein
MNSSLHNISDVLLGNGPINASNVFVCKYEKCLLCF